MLRVIYLIIMILLIISCSNLNKGKEIISYLYPNQELNVMKIIDIIMIDKSIVVLRADKPKQEKYECFIDIFFRNSKINKYIYGITCKLDGVIGFANEITGLSEKNKLISISFNDGDHEWNELFSLDSGKIVKLQIPKDHLINNFKIKDNIGYYSIFNYIKYFNNEDGFIHWFSYDLNNKTKTKLFVSGSNVKSFIVNDKSIIINEDKGNNNQATVINLDNYKTISVNSFLGTQLIDYERMLWLNLAKDKKIELLNKDKKVVCSINTKGRVIFEKEGRYLKFYDYDGKKIIICDIEKKKIKKIKQKGATRIFDDYIYWIEEDGYLYREKI